MSTNWQDEVQPKTVNYAYLNDAQFIARTTVGGLSSALSLAGSITILYLVFKHGKWRTEIYQRLVMGLSVMDLVLTCSIVASPFAAPTETNLMLASGSFTTCEISGFFFQFYTGGTIYNALLASFYHLMVVNNKQERQICRILEPWGHILAFGVPIGFGSAAIALDALNPSISMGVCLYTTYPSHCNDLQDIDCERGANTGIFVFLVNLIYMIAAILGIFFTVRVFLSVRHQIRRNLEYGTGQLSETQVKRIKAVRTQATLYCLAFVNGFLPVLFTTTITAVNSQRYDRLEDPPDLGENAAAFALTLVIFIFFPLQGFLNCLVYIRPRLVRWKDAHPHESWLKAFRNVLSNNPAPRTSQRNYLCSVQCGRSPIHKSFLGILFWPGRSNSNDPSGQAVVVEQPEQNNSQRNSGGQEMDERRSTRNGSSGDPLLTEETPCFDQQAKDDSSAGQMEQEGRSVSEPSKARPCEVGAQESSTSLQADDSRNGEASTSNEIEPEQQDTSAESVGIDKPATTSSSTLLFTQRLHSDRETSLPSNVTISFVPISSFSAVEEK